ncbi:alpha/beta fold hydrolase [Levilactobacillus sp. N40-8-2]|uniref:alpha/beta fold hydrolase n=1 Tax=Levilactobacillus muriae TaxID=3238987 RepID=UPI0038B38775
MTGTGPRGGQGIRDVTKISDWSLVKAIFTRTANGKRQAVQFLKRLTARRENRDRSIGWSAYRTQLKAIHRWGSEQPIDFSELEIPVLVTNGDHDIMVPTKPNSDNLAKAFSHSQLIIYPDAGHAGGFSLAVTLLSGLTNS